MTYFSLSCFPIGQLPIELITLIGEGKVELLSLKTFFIIGGFLSY